MNKMIKLPLFLGICGAACAGVLAGVNALTSPIIEQAKIDAQKATMAETAPPQAERQDPNAPQRGDESTLQTGSIHRCPVRRPLSAEMGVRQYVLAHDQIYAAQNSQKQSKEGVNPDERCSLFNVGRTGNDVRLRIAESGRTVSVQPRRNFQRYQTPVESRGNDTYRSGRIQTAPGGIPLFISRIQAQRGIVAHQ